MEIDVGAIFSGIVGYYNSSEIMFIFSFLHVSSCYCISIFYLTSKFQINENESTASPQDLYIETLNFITYTFSSLGFGYSFPSDDLGMVITIFLMIAGLLLFSYFVTKLQVLTEKLLTYEEYAQMRDNLFDSWLAQLEKASKESGLSHFLVKNMKEHHRFYQRFDISEFYGSAYFPNLSYELQSEVTDNLLTNMASLFSVFFKSIDQSLWLQVFLCLKFRM